MFFVQAVGAELKERAEVPSQLEADSQALAQFVSSGEAARIKARLTQIGRYWEELKESVEQLDGQLEESSSHQQKFRSSLQDVSRLTDVLTEPFSEDIYMKFIFISLQVEASLRELHTKLEQPIKSCTSSSETYKALQNHMVCSLISTFFT